MTRGAEKLGAAIEHHQAGRLQQAEQIYRHILDRHPGDADALHLLGLIAFQNGRTEEAVEKIRRAIGCHPSAPVYYDNLGKILQAAGRGSEAAACFRDWIARRPDDVEARLCLGNHYLRENRLAEAGDCFRQALERKPDFAEALTNLGYALRQQGNSPEAIGFLHRAIEIRPDNPEAHLTLGAALEDLGEYEEAASVLSRLLDLKPDLAEAHHNLGSVRRDQGLLEEAAACHQAALRLKPGYADSCNNLGVVRLLQGRIEDALAGFREAIRQKPSYAAAHSNLLLTLHYLPSPDPAALYNEHRQWDRQHGEPLAAAHQPPLNDRSPERRLRIGYLSADFRTHPVAFFFGPILDLHTRVQFHCFCYSNVSHPDAVTSSLEALAEEWRNIRRLTDEQVAELVRQDRIDILVDLGGHTSENRLPVFARKPAPVQVSYLGYPDTTGLTAIDYRLTDAWADPPGETESWHSEELARLPSGFLCYKPFTDAPAVAEPPVLRTGAFTFGSFNCLPKVTPDVIRTWAAILQAAPGARLLLKAKALADEGARRRVLEMFSDHGIPADRIQLMGLFPDLLRHLETYHQVDLALDPFPYNGTTTTCEALWMGVPVVTLPGRTHASRVGLSLLSRMDLSEFIADSWQGYVELAARWAGNPGPLRKLRAQLRDRMRRSSLTDTKSFVRELEQSYRRMWRRFCQQNAPPRSGAAAGIEQLRQRVAAFPYWYHAIELPGGVKTPGWAPISKDSYRIPADLTGQRVLDVGAWDGFWTFQALQRGAREVVAIDDFSDYLGRLQASHRRAWETFDFCRGALGYSPERAQRYDLSVYEVSEERFGRFDIVFCFGTLYHLRHPLLALDRLSAICNREIYVESAILDDYSPYRGGLGQGYSGGQMVAEFYPASQYGNNPTNWWVPTLHCLANMVGAAGFPAVEAWKLTAAPPTHIAHCRGFVKGSKKAPA